MVLAILRDLLSSPNSSRQAGTNLGSQGFGLVADRLSFANVRAEYLRHAEVRVASGEFSNFEVSDQEGRAAVD